MGTWQSDSPCSLVQGGGISDQGSEAEGRRDPCTEAGENLCVQNCNCIGLIKKGKGGRKAESKEEGDGL